jgi:hypothetical protein
MFAKSQVNVFGKTDWMLMIERKLLWAREIGGQPRYVPGSAAWPAPQMNIKIRLLTETAVEMNVMEEIANAGNYNGTQFLMSRWFQK